MKPLDTTNTAINYPFLADGGELGELTRTYNWATTPLGTPDQWPLSLRTTIGIVLHSAFPMFLFWGPDLLCFYNDAYRSSLGETGKHPALGKRGADVWPETWDFIGPMIQQVIGTGNPTFYEDQLVPIYRNGKLEDVYWTFSYSPAYGDAGQINGVFVTCTETTNAVVSRRKLEEGQHQLLRSFEQSPVGVAIISGENDLVFQMANPVYSALAGRRPDELVGKPLLEAIPELQGQGFDELLRQVIRTGEPFVAYEAKAEIRQGTTIGFIYANHHFQPQRNPAGHNDVLIVAIDVTQQVLARRRVEESEAKLRSVITDSPVAICLFVGPDLIIDVANDRMIRFFGRGPSIVGKPVREVLTGQSGDASAVALLTQVFNTGEPFTATAAPANLTIDGVAGTYYFDLSLTPLRNAAGAVYAVLETATDVTDTVIARQKQEEAEAALREAIELAELATWTLDIKTGTFQYSARFMNWLGFSANTKNLDEAYNPLPEPYRQSVADAINAVIQPGASGVYENEHPIINRLTDQVRIIHAQARVHYDALGNPEKLAGTAQDITIQRELQLALEQQVQQRTEELAALNEELAAANEELAASNEELLVSNEEASTANDELTAANSLLSRSNSNLEKFAYVASHDLQEPLRKIQAFGDLLKNQYADQLGEGVTHLERMQAASNRMSTLIRDLLTYSRIATQQERIDTIPLTDVITSVLTDLELRIQETEATVRVTDDLPTIQGDRSQLEQLFQNLLSNALKFRRAEVKPIIRMAYRLVLQNELPPTVKPVRVAAFYHCIEVIDNGIGFDEKYLDRIFQVFQRLSGRNQYAGTGIGLAICEKVVANHGGAITASSQPGAGATFSIYLPADRPVSRYFTR